MFNVLGGTPTATKESIQGKTNGALGMFHLAIEKLEESNKEAVDLAAANQKVVDKLTQDNVELNDLAADNNKVIANIKKMLGL